LRVPDERGAHVLLRHVGGRRREGETAREIEGDAHRGRGGVGWERKGSESEAAKVGSQERGCECAVTTPAHVPCMNSVAEQRVRRCEDERERG
jgi:hypothetical protein